MLPALCEALPLALFTLVTPELLTGAAELLLLSEEALDTTRFATPGLGRTLGTEAREESEEAALDVVHRLDESDVDAAARCFKESEAELEEGGLLGVEELLADLAAGSLLLVVEGETFFVAGPDFFEF